MSIPAHAPTVPRTTVRRLEIVGSTWIKPKIKTVADDVKKCTDRTGRQDDIDEASLDKLGCQVDYQAEGPDKLSQTLEDVLKIEDTVTRWESDVTAASRETMEWLQQVAEIRVDENRAASLIDTDEEGEMLVTLFKTGLSHRGLKIDDATRQPLVTLLHDQAAVDDQADGQNRLVKNVLGTDKETTELKQKLQTCTDERDKLQSSLEHLTRDHDAAKARNEELTNKLAELQQNQPDVGLPKRLEEVEKSNAEMENELVKWRSGEKMWQEELRKKDDYIWRLRSDLDNEKMLHKRTRRLWATH